MLLTVQLCCLQLSENWIVGVVTRRLFSAGWKTGILIECLFASACNSHDVVFPESQESETSESGRK